MASDGRTVSRMGSGEGAEYPFQGRPYPYEGGVLSSAQEPIPVIVLKSLWEKTQNAQADEASPNSDIKSPLFGRL